MFLSNRVILSNLSFIYISIFIFFSRSSVQSKPRISDKNIVLKPTITVNTSTPTAIPKTIDVTPTSTPIPTVSDEEKIVPPFPQQLDFELTPTTVPKPTAIVPTLLPDTGDTLKN